MIFLKLKPAYFKAVFNVLLLLRSVLFGAFGVLSVSQKYCNK
jgi:hypothetical protein